MTTEILYCARCRRVIRPKEITEGKYHFADGDPVCAECFTRLSRRLQPVSGIHEPPKPVDLSGITGASADATDAESSAGAPAAEAAPKPTGREPPGPAPIRSGPGMVAKVLVLLAFVLAGASAGYGVYLVMRSTPHPEAQGSPPPAASTAK